MLPVILLIPNQLISSPEFVVITTGPLVVLDPVVEELDVDVEVLAVVEVDVAALAVVEVDVVTLAVVAVVAALALVEVGPALRAAWTARPTLPKGVPFQSEIREGKVQSCTHHAQAVQCIFFLHIS